jgi:ABC-2 type transport system permease protein
MTDASVQTTPRAVRVVEGDLVSPSSNQGLLEVFRRHYLLNLLVRRELSSRYEGSFLGFVWSYINPLSQFFIYWFVMGKLMGAHHNIPNYPIHIFSALIVVHFFTETFGAGTRSIVRNKALLTKQAMPREMFPVAAMLVSLVHVGPQIVILVIFDVLAGWRPDPMGMVALLLALGIAMVLGTALALLFSVANVYFRDFGSFVGIATNYVRWGVPMVYSWEMVSHALGSVGKLLYLSDPIAVGVLLIQRAFWTGSVHNKHARAVTAMPDHLLLIGLISLGASVVTLVIAQVVFNKFEKKIPERL